MNNEVNGLEEAGKAIMDRWADASQEFDGDEQKVAQALAEAAAPAIRSQERQRVLAKLQERAIAPELLAFTQQLERQRVREALLSDEVVERFGTGYWRAIAEKQKLQRQQRHGEAKDIFAFRRALEAALNTLEDS